MQFTDFVNIIDYSKGNAYYNMNRCILCTQARFSHAGSHSFYFILLFLRVCELAYSLWLLRTYMQRSL